MVHTRSENVNVGVDDEEYPLDESVYTGGTQEEPRMYSGGAVCQTKTSAPRTESFLSDPEYILGSSCVNGLDGLVIPGVTGEVEWCNGVFNLARRLQAAGIKDCADGQLLGMLCSWYERLESPGFTLEDLLTELDKGWDKVRNPEGRKLAEIVEGPDNDPLVGLAKKVAAVGPLYEKLVRICRNLHRYYKGKAFPLGCRKAGELLGVSQVKANAMLRVLERFGVLRRELKGSLALLPGRDKPTASEWTYAADDEPDGGNTRQ